LRPKESGRAWRSEFQKASAVCARQRAARGVGDGAGDHHRPAPPGLVEELLDGEQRGLGIQRVEHRFHQQDVGAAGGQAARGFHVIGHQRIESDIARAGVVNVGRQRGGARRRSQHAGDEARLVGRRVFVGNAARQFRRCDIEFESQFGQPVFRLRDARAVEGVGLDDVGARLQVGLVDTADHVGPRDAEKVVVALEVLGRSGKTLAAVVGLDQFFPLHHGAHGAVEDQDALRQQLAQFGAAVGLPALSIVAGGGGSRGHASLQIHDRDSKRGCNAARLMPRRNTPRVGERR